MAVLPSSRLRAQTAASYRVTCRYDEAKKTLEGTERLDWKNATSHPVSSLRFVLPLNAFRNNRSTYWRDARSRGIELDSRDGGWGSATISRMTSASGEDLLAQARFVAPDDGNGEDRTVLEVSAERPVPAGATVRLDIDFVSRFPRLGPHGGWKGGFLLAADGFPAIGAVGEEGWQARQARPDSEASSDFADYDVLLDLPARLRGKVAGTGRLLEERDAPGERVLEHFRADGVRGFAWAADAGLDVETERLSTPGFPDVDLALLTQSEHRIYRGRLLRAARIALGELQKRLGACPFSSLTFVDIPWGGPEGLRSLAPGLFAGRIDLLSPDGVWTEGSPEAVVFQGIAAQWFEESIASDPAERPRLDRAIARYLAARLDRRAFGNSHGVLPVFGYPFVVRSMEVPPSPEPRSGGEPGRIEAALETLERVSGEPAVDAVLASYAKTHRGRPSRSGDFLAVLERSAGSAWAAFFRAALRGSGIDYRVSRAVSVPSAAPLGLLEEGGRTSEVSAASAPRRRGYDTEVLVERRGGAAVPVEIRLDFEGGRTHRTVWNGASDWIRFRVENGPRLVRAVADPDGRIAADRMRSNNGWIVKSDAAAANLWTARAFFWSENLIDLFMELW
jgi:hypothetical protein